MMRLPPWTLGLTFLLLPACNDLPTQFDALPPTRVEITSGNCGAASPQVIVGRDCELAAMAFDDNGREVRVGFAWSTGDPSLATVAPKPGFDTTVAEITGIKVGITTIRVELGADPDVSRTHDLRVLPPQQPN